MNIDHGKREWTSEELDGLREALEEAATKAGLSWAEVSRRSQVAPSTLSQFRSASYKGDNSSLASQLTKWLDAHNRERAFRVTAPPEPTFVETRTAMAVFAALQHAQLLDDTSVIVGPPGIGKTAALAQYSARNPRVYRITASPAVSTPSAVLAAFIEKYSPEHRRSERTLIARTTVVRQFLTRGALAAVDEAQHLSMAALEELRAIHDATKCGLALIGNPQVLNRIQGANRDPAYAQIFGRVGQRTVLKKGVEADVAPVLETMGVTASDVLEEVMKVAKVEDLRVVVKVTRSALLLANGNSENIEAKHVRAAYRNLGGQQAAA